MKRIILRYLVCCIGMIYSVLPIVGQDLVATGKTWWYWTRTSYREGFQKVILGLTLEEPDSTGWTACYAIDSLRNKVLDVPVAHLMEKNKVVSLRPNFELSEIAADVWSNEVIILMTFLGYSEGNDIYLIKYNYPDCDYVWNPEGQKEFLLYDFNDKDEEMVYEWPWAGRDLDDSDIVNKDVGSFMVTGVGYEKLPVADQGERRVKVYEMEQIWNIDDNGTRTKLPSGTAKIMEGIGIVDGNIESYIRNLETWYGFFIAPQSICLPEFSGGFNLPGIPSLYAVEEADGTTLIINQKDYDYLLGIPDTVTYRALIDHNVYDLHGREVSKPQAGSIYIRDGKKFVAR